MDRQFRTVLCPRVRLKWLFDAGEKARDQRLPDRPATLAAGQQMAVAPEGAERLISRLAARGVVGRDHALGEAGFEEAVVLGIDPEHRDARRGAVLARRQDQRL